MINKIKVLAADVDMTLSSKSSPLPKSQYRLYKNCIIEALSLVWQPEEKSPKWKKQKEYSGN